MFYLIIVKYLLYLYLGLLSYLPFCSSKFVNIKKLKIQTKTRRTIDNNKSTFLSAILLLPESHCSRKLISIVSRSRPLPASRPVRTWQKYSITWRKELYYFAFLSSSSIMVDYIKSFGREKSRQHKQSAVLHTFDVQSLNFCLEGKTWRETTVQAKLSVQAYKSDCVSADDRWI